MYEKKNTRREEFEPLTLHIRCEVKYHHTINNINLILIKNSNDFLRIYTSYDIFKKNDVIIELQNLNFFNISINTCIHIYMC